jgi:hypothetical protein
MVQFAVRDLVVAGYNRYFLRIAARRLLECVSESHTSSLELSAANSKE